MPPPTLTPGTTYRVRRTLTEGNGFVAGRHLTFWRDAYTFHDGCSAYFFAHPDDYFSGPPGGNEHLLRIFRLDLHDRDAIPAILALFEPLCRPEQLSTRFGGTPWIPAWWETKVAPAPNAMAREIRRRASDTDPAG